MFDQEESSVKFVSLFTLYWNTSSAEVRALEFKDSVLKSSDLGVISWAWGNDEVVRAESESGFSFSLDFGSSGFEVGLAGLNRLSGLLTSGVSIEEVSWLVGWWHLIIFIERYFQLNRLILVIFFTIFIYSYWNLILHVFAHFFD